MSNLLKRQNNSEPTTHRDFEPIKNPYIVGNPIKSTEMFFGREEDFKNIQNWIVNDGPHVILLIGGRRSGKTSILWQILGGRLHQAGEAILCDFHNIVPRIKQDEDLPFEVGKAILENPKFKPFEADFLKEDNTSWTVRLQKLVQNSLAIIEPRKLIVLCDEFEAIEELFKSAVLSANALLWVKQVLNLPVHFVITGSHEFQDNTVSSVFSPVAQMYPIYELSMPDALALIKKPIGEHLIYKDEVLKIIYRLSGGHPFYTQYICHTLVNHVNAEIKRNSVVAKDLEGVIDFIVRSPTGHIQETWKSLSNPNYVPKYGRETLAALANTIKHSKEYVSTSRIFKTVRKKRFEVADKQALYKKLAWFIQNTRLLERKSETYRFRIDLIRHWISYEFQTGEDIEPLVGGSVVPTLTQESPKKEEVGQRLWHPLPPEEKQGEVSVKTLRVKYRWVVIFLGILIGITLFFQLTPERPIGDQIKPNGKIIGIKPSYREGDEIVYLIECSDNKALSSVSFRVEDSSVKQTWEVSGKEINKQFSFSTKGWQLNKRYVSILIVIDKAGNTFKKENSFLVKGTETTPVPLNKPLLNVYLWHKKVTFEISANDLFEDDRIKLKALAERVFKEMGYKIVDSFFSKDYKKIGSFLYLTKTGKQDNFVYSQPITFPHQGIDKSPVELYFAISLQEYFRGASAFIHKFNMALNKLSLS